MPRRKFCFIDHWMTYLANFRYCLKSLTNFDIRLRIKRVLLWWIIVKTLISNGKTNLYSIIGVAINQSKQWSRQELPLLWCEHSFTAYLSKRWNLSRVNHRRRNYDKWKISVCTMTISISFWTFLFT